MRFNAIELTIPAKTAMPIKPIMAQLTGQPSLENKRIGFSDTRFAGYFTSLLKIETHTTELNPLLTAMNRL
jgi:hypothetical protein